MKTIRHHFWHTANYMSCCCCCYCYLYYPYCYHHQPLPVKGLVVPRMTLKSTLKDRRGGIILFFFSCITMFSILNKKQQIYLLFILKKPIYKGNRVWAPLCPMRWGNLRSIGSALTYRHFFHGCRWRERLRCWGGADHGESCFLSWVCQAAVLGPASWRVASFLEAEERSLKERAAGTWQLGSWSSGSQAVVLRPWPVGRRNGEISTISA